MQRLKWPNSNSNRSSLHRNSDAATRILANDRSELCIDIFTFCNESTVRGSSTMLEWRVQLPRQLSSLRVVVHHNDDAQFIERINDMWR